MHRKIFPIFLNRLLHHANDLLNVQYKLNIIFLLASSLFSGVLFEHAYSLTVCYDISDLLSYQIRKKAKCTHRPHLQSYRTIYNLD